MSDKIREWWKPEPRLWDWAFWSLLCPAAIWVLGVIVYGAQALMAQALTWDRQGWGSFLMVIGGESGTLFTVMEVFRKSKSSDANGWDWSGIFVSLVSTLGVLLVIFTRQTELAAPWIEPVRNWGPLLLLLCSALDFYANVIELGYYRASFEERWEKWNTGRWNHIQREHNRLRESQEPAELREASTADRQRIFAGFNGNRGELTIESWNAALIRDGKKPDAPSTAQYWVDKAQEEQP
jgi:hypothetical protein